MCTKNTHTKYHLIEDARGFYLMDDDTYKERILHCSKIISFAKRVGFYSKEDVVSYISKHSKNLKDIIII